MRSTLKIQQRQVIIMSDLQTYTPLLQEIEAITERLAELNSLESMSAIEIQEEQLMLSQLHSLNLLLNHSQHVTHAIHVSHKIRRRVQKALLYILALAMFMTVLATILAGAMLVVQELLALRVQGILGNALW